MGTVCFPGLGLELHLNRVAFHLGSWPVYWYGIIIAAGFILAVLFCSRQAKGFGIRRMTSLTCSSSPCPLAS